MGTKSPGVYITENDVSTYTTSDGSTIVALVGYASKGPIGEPVICSSYKNFVETFGTPTIVGYSGLAVKNIFAVGTTVIFYRVADDTATSSVKIVKNAVAATMGYQTLQKPTDILIGADGYENGKIYALNVKESALTGAATKVFYVRSPLSGKLAISDILGQLSAQVGETSGYQEFALPNTYAKPGWYSFNFKVDSDVDAVVDGEGLYDVEVGSKSDVCAFVELNSADKYDTIRAKIKTAAEGGSNPIAVLTLSQIAAANPTLLTNVGFTTVGGEAANCQFNLTVNSNTYVLDIPMTNTMTFEELLVSLNKVLKAYGVFAVFKAGTVVDAAQIVFVSKSRGSGNTISISPVSTLIDTSAKQNLFLAAEGVTIAGFTGTRVSGKSYLNIAAYEDFEGKVTKRDINDDFRFTVELDEYTKGLKIVSASTGTTSKIKLIDGAYGVSLLDTTAAGPAIGNLLTEINGTAAINLSVERDATTKKIKFVSKNTSAPVLTAYSGVSYIGTLDKIMLAIEAGVTGTAEVSASDKDIIIIKSIEKGSDTAKITVEKSVTVNPIDSTKNTVNIFVYYDGTLKETFSDVSLDKNNTTNRFDIVINNTSENGGSEYINVEFVKNENSGDYANIVNFPNGSYTLGVAVAATDVAANETTNLEDYLSYDYAVGDNGIPSIGGEDLFIEALSTTGDLANTDLYNFHILITPDNIEQSVQQAAIELAAYRKDFVYIADAPFGLTADGAKNWHNGQGFGREVAVDSSYAAAYWPWVKVYDTANKKYVWTPPSVVIAAKYVDNDRVYGSWFAPAGELRGRLVVGDIEYSARRDERDEIYTGLNRVNPIIKFNDGRTIVYGEKTCLRDNSALSKLHTRRMIVDIKKQVRAALQSFLFMPNVAEVWNKAASTINAILEPYKRGNGISYYNTVVTASAEDQQQDIMTGTIHIVPCGVIEDIEITLNVDKVGTVVSVE